LGVVAAEPAGAGDVMDVADGMELADAAGDLTRALGVLDDAKVCA